MAFFGAEDLLEGEVGLWIQKAHGLVGLYSVSRLYALKFDVGVSPACDLCLIRRFAPGFEAFPAAGDRRGGAFGLQATVAPPILGPSEVLTSIFVFAAPKFPLRRNAPPPRAALGL